MRKAALLASALVGMAAGALVPSQGGSSAQQMAQEAKAQAERSAQGRLGGPSAPQARSGFFDLGLGRGSGFGSPRVGGYRKKPRGTHKQNALVEAKRRARR